MIGTFVARFSVFSFLLLLFCFHAQLVAESLNLSAPTFQHLWQQKKNSSKRIIGVECFSNRWRRRRWPARRVARDPGSARRQGTDLHAGQSRGDRGREAGQRRVTRGAHRDAETGRRGVHHAELQRENIRQAAARRHLVNVSAVFLHI